MMNDDREILGMVPYPLIFPDAEEGVAGFTLPHKIGKAKAGDYSFLESYCVDTGCDCRRAAICVINDKGKTAAVIEFGFDPDHPMAGPYLNEYEKQSAAAADLLLVFVQVVNDNPDWIKGMYKRYRAVRKKIDGRAYRGKPFVKPETVKRTMNPPLDEEEDVFQQMLEAAVRTPPMPRRKKVKERNAPSEPLGILSFIERYRQELRDDTFSTHRDIQSELRLYLLDREDAGEELAARLPELYPKSEAEEERFEAALRVLFDAFEILRIELERNRPGSQERMERWQDALARHVYGDGSEGDVVAAVTHILLQARVEILPRLHEANRSRIVAQGEGDPSFRDLSEEDMLVGLFRSFEELEAESPFELFDAFLQMMAVGDAQVQIGLCEAMLTAENPLIRETAALMLFHPQDEVRRGVAQVLAAAEGSRFTSEALRRLIIARNWFPEEIRAHIDQIVTNARKGRVECAPILQRTEMSVHASVVDGAGAQSFQIFIPDGKSFFSCSILLKQGVGVPDAFLVPLKNKRELKEFQAMIRREVGFLESSPDYLDRRVCQALDEGALRGKVPNHWLIAIAERLGRDGWRRIPCDPLRELEILREELEEQESLFLTRKARDKALEASAGWPQFEHFGASWFEDDAEVDRTVEASSGRRKKEPDPGKAISAILKEVLAERRGRWTERLVLTTLWLKSAKKPPVPWEQMFHVAEEVADETCTLEEIPLMVSVAGASLGAYLGRKSEGR